jgi:hypothetical protein
MGCNSLALLLVLIVQHARSEAPPVLIHDPFFAIAEAGENPATRPAPDFDGLDPALELIPSGVLPDKVDGWNVAKMDAANDVFRERILNHRMRLKVKVAGISQIPPDSYQVTDDSLSNPTFRISAQCLFARAAVLQVARLKPGREVSVEGIVKVISFEQPLPPSPCTLEIQLDSCQVLQPMPPGNGK